MTIDVHPLWLAAGIVVGGALGALMMWLFLTAGDGRAGAVDVDDWYFEQQMAQEDHECVPEMEGMA